MTHSQCKIAIVEDTYITKLQELKKKAEESGGSSEFSLPDLFVVNGKTGEVSYSPTMLTADGSLTSYPPIKHENSLAYVLYTSGSTGKPKGVMVRDISVVNIIAFFADQLSVTQEDHIMGLTTFCFDISVLEIFVPLFSGATFVLVSSATQKNPFKIIQTLTQYQISIMQATPTTYEMMLSCSNMQEFSHLKCLVGGEACRPKVAELAKIVRGLYNVYGPTETTIWSSSALLEKDRDYHTTGIPVGQPIRETTFYLVLEEEVKKEGKEEGKSEETAAKKTMKFSEVHDEGEGELWIGGLGVARGYLHADHLTVARFLANPFTRQGSCYRTGDIFKRTSQGEYIFVRRLDDQVKVAGFRIELAEVEMACSKHPLIEQVVDIVKSDRLVVFVKLITSTSSDPKHQKEREEVMKSPLKLRELIRHTAEQTVPHYMVPSIVRRVEDFPKTANGKLDKMKLAELLADEETTTAAEVTSQANEEQLSNLNSTQSIAAIAAIAAAAAMAGGAILPSSIKLEQQQQQKKKDQADVHTIMGFIIKAVRNISGFRPLPTSSFAAVGIDSLAAMLFRNYLSQSLGNVEIDGSELYDPDMTILKFASKLYQKLQSEKPQILVKLQIQSIAGSAGSGGDGAEAAEGSEKQDSKDGDDLETGKKKTDVALTAMDDNKQNNSEEASTSISRIMLQKRLLLDGLRGFVALWIIIDHFSFNSTVKGTRIRADTAIFIVMTGFSTALQEISQVEAQGVALWKPWAFLHSRFLGLFPIYWLVIILNIPYLYVNFNVANDDIQANFGSILVLYIFGLQEWTLYDNDVIRAVYYVSLIWGVFQMYAIMKTIYRYDTLAWFYRWCMIFACIAFLVGMLVYNTTGGTHCPMGVLYFYLGYLAALILQNLILYGFDAPNMVYEEKKRIFLKYCYYPTTSSSLGGQQPRQGGGAEVVYNAAAASSLTAVKSAAATANDGQQKMQGAGGGQDEGRDTMVTEEGGGGGGVKMIDNPSTSSKQSSIAAASPSASASASMDDDIASGTIAYNKNKNKLEKDQLINTAASSSSSTAHQQQGFTPTPTSPWWNQNKKYIIAIAVDIWAFQLIFFTFFTNYPWENPNQTYLHDPIYNKYDQVMNIYGNPIMFAILLILCFLQPGSIEYSLFSNICSHSKILPLMGECSLSIYIVQLTFVPFYWQLAIQGVIHHAYPWSRSFYNEYFARSAELADQEQYLAPGVIIAVLIGIFIQKVYQDRFIVQLHLRLMKWWNERQLRLRLEAVGTRGASGDGEEEEEEEGGMEDGTTVVNGNPLRNDN